MARQPKKVSDQAVKDAPSVGPSSSSRFAAGEDPVKRGQILDGAKRVFMKMGFDAASMNDVTREAGVSKGTIYVYFESKEDLFAALIEREKGRFTETLRDILADSQGVEDGLRRFGLAFARQILTGDMIPAMRTVLGVVDRMPGVCRRFLSAAPANARTVLEEFLRRKVAEGALKSVDEELAARQFIDLATGTYFKLKLFNELQSIPDKAEVEHVVDSAIYVFMSAYGPDSTA
ncbi:MAG: TetR family transcriptional regulator [Shinella sp.]|nr:MAG: TetR family transcriptional regulator [Shinella sp.]